MILHVRIRWFRSNVSIGFSQFYRLRYKQGLRISTTSCEMRKTDQDISKLNFILYTAGKFIQCCALIVTGKISKEFIGECWTYSISVLPKLQLLGTSRANLREKKHDVFTFQFPV